MTFLLSGWKSITLRDGHEQRKWMSEDLCMGDERGEQSLQVGVRSRSVHASRSVLQGVVQGRELLLQNRPYRGHLVVRH